MATTRIYCPRCEWAPGPHDEWQCTPGCGTVWNTFETRARCPGCSKQWRVTTCLACFVASLHEEWYHDEDTAQDAWADAVAHDEELVEVGAGDDDGDPWRPPPDAGHAGRRPARRTP